MPGAHADGLLEYLSSRRDSMVTLLERLVAAESPSTVPAAQRPVQDILKKELEEIGFRGRRIAGVETGGHLLAVSKSRRRGKPLQLMVGHCDTVWPIGTLEEMPLRREPERLSGPGAFDMKAGLVAMIYALQSLAALEIELEVEPILLINSDEEIGSPESDRHIARLAKRAERVWILEPAMGRRGRLKTARKGVGEFTIRVYGRAAHAGLEPGRGVSAIVELSQVVQRLSSLSRSRQGLTVNIGTIGGGSRSNVVAAEAFLTVDVRFKSMKQWEDAESVIRGLRPGTPGARLEIEGRLNKPPLERTPRNRLLWQAAKEIGRELGLELEQAQVGGASDGNTASLHAPTLDGLGPAGGGAHARHEFVLVDSLVERTALLALLLASPGLSERPTG